MAGLLENDLPACTWRSRIRPGRYAVLDEYPRSIDEALEKAGLGWKVTHGDALVARAPEWTDDFGTSHPAELIFARAFEAPSTCRGGQEMEGACARRGCLINIAHATERRS